MKRNLLVTVSLSTLMIASCGSKHFDAEVVGSWKGTVNQGTEALSFKAKLPAVDLEIEKDHSFTMSSITRSTGHWQVQGNVLNLFVENRGGHAVNNEDPITLNISEDGKNLLSPLQGITWTRK